MDAERVRAQLKRVLGNSAFADAEHGSRFLRFVVEAALEGRTGEIKESVIGVEALGRSTSFDPKTDPIVRVEAGDSARGLARTTETKEKQTPS